MSVLNEVEMVILDVNVDNNREPYERAVRSVALKHNGKSEVFEYKCSSANCIIRKENVMECLLSDMDAYTVSEDVLDFAMNFGYSTSTFEDCRETRRIYKACEEEVRQLRELFTEDEIAELFEEMFGEM